MAEQRDVTIFYDERMLEHRPEASDEFLPGRLADRIQDIIAGLPFTWTYPEVPGRLAAIMDQLNRSPVPRHTSSTGPARDAVAVRVEAPLVQSARLSGTERVGVHEPAGEVLS